MKALFLALGILLATGSAYAGTQEEKPATATTQTEKSDTPAKGSKKSKKAKKACCDKKSEEKTACCAKKGEEKTACCAKKAACDSTKSKKDCPANAKSENGKGKKTGHTKSETK